MSGDPAHRELAESALGDAAAADVSRLTGLFEDHPALAEQLRAAPDAERSVRARGLASVARGLADARSAERAVQRLESELARYLADSEG